MILVLSRRGTVHLWCAGPGSVAVGLRVLVVLVGLLLQSRDEVHYLGELPLVLLNFLEDHGDGLVLGLTCGEAADHLRLLQAEAGADGVGPVCGQLVGLQRLRLPDVDAQLLVVVASAGAGVLIVLAARCCLLAAGGLVNVS